MTMENAGHFQSQLTSLMNAVVTAAVVEIVRLVEDSAVVLRQQLSKSKLENEALKVENDSNKKKLQILEGMSIATNQRSVVRRPVAEADAGRKYDEEDGKGEKTGAELQSQEPAGQSQWKLLKVVTMEKDGLKVLCIKKEINDDTEHDTPSPMTDEQPCPKVDMVFDKEWSQSLWRDDGIDSKDRTEEKETPGSSMTQHQKRKRRVVNYVDDWIEEEADWIKEDEADWIKEDEEVWIKEDEEDWIKEDEEDWIKEDEEDLSKPMKVFE